MSAIAPVATTIPVPQIGANFGDQPVGKFGQISFNSRVRQSCGQSPLGCIDVAFRNRRAQAHFEALAEIYCLLAPTLKSDSER